MLPRLVRSHARWRSARESVRRVRTRRGCTARAAGSTYRRAMRLRPSPALIATTAAATLLLTGLLAGCSTSEKPSGLDPGPTASTPTHSVTPGTGPTATFSPTGATTPTPTEGDGDSEGDDTPATAGGGICSDLPAADVGRILGGATKGAALPGGGCGFTLTAAKGPSATFIEKSVARTPGGMAGAKTDATSSVEGEPQDLTGIGDAAFVVTGTAFGEPAIQGAGAVRVGTRIINVNLNQSGTMPSATVRAMMVKLLRLAAAQSS